MVDVAIVGGGPAGLAAAIAAHKAGATVTLLEREPRAGGILRQCIHNGFGVQYFGKELTGPEYATRLVREAQGLDIRTGAMAVGHREGALTVAQEGAGVYELPARAVVLATGCRERPRGALRIPGTRPAGVMTAGFAQYMMNLRGLLPGKRVVILGSGDIGLIMARRCTWEGAKVLCVAEAAPYVGGLARNVAQCLEDFDIPLALSTTVAAVHGTGRVEGLTMCRVDEKFNPIAGTQWHIECDTLLLSVGLIPENELARALGVAIDPVTGGAIVNEKLETSVPGVFACGNTLLVNDLADEASRQGEIAGAAAAAHAGGAGRSHQVACGDNVRLCVPQQITEGATDVTLRLRVSAPLGRGHVVVRCGDTQLTKKAFAALVPGEMVHITVPGPAAGDWTVEARGINK